MAFLEPKSLIRIANALESLRALYELDLASRGLMLQAPTATEEGEIFGTDDIRIAEAIAREVYNRPERDGAGLFIGEFNATATPPPPEGAENQAGWDHPSLFGGSWGLNTGPEGSEENWGGPPSNRGTRETAPGDVREQGNSEKQEK